MEREYLFWHTGNGCLVAFLAVGGVTLVLFAAMLWSGANRWSLLGIAFYVPALWLSFRADRRVRRKRS